MPTIANVDARDFSDLACWLIVQIGPISLNVTTPPRIMPRVLIEWGLKPLTDPSEMAADDRQRNQSPPLPGISHQAASLPRPFLASKSNRVFGTHRIEDPSGDLSADFPPPMV